MSARIALGALLAAIVLVEHAVIRRGRWATYATADWATARRLPLGLAAVLAFCGSIALIVPSMDQVWYAGPIAKSGTGDIAMFTGFASAALLYVPLRLLERRWEGRLGWLEREAY